MGEFEKLLEESLELKEIRRGEVIKCKVVKLDDRNVYVDIGYKVEGIIPRDELPDAKVGDEIKATVVRFTKGGSPLLSYRKYMEERFIGFLRNAFEKGRFITGTVVGKSEEGYLVDISGLRALLPYKEAMKNLKEGRKVVVKITKLEREEGKLKVTLSQRDYIRRKEERKKERILSKLKVGDVVEGKVIKIDPDKGITLLIGGVLRAFLPLEELSWSRDRNPYNYAEIDERLRVKVKRIPKDGQFVFVSLRDMKENPWEKVKESLQKGQKVSGKVVEVNDKGLVVEVMEGVEGFVPKDEVSYDGTTYRKGDKVSAQVLEVDPSRKKLILSIKRTLPKPWEEYTKENPVGSRVFGKVERIEGARAFVDLGKGVVGVIHRIDLSWLKPGRIEDVLKVGELREFAVLGLDGKYVKLGLKQLTENPWDKVLKNYKVGDKVKLTVKSVHPFGAFLQFPEGLDGLLPISEIPKGVKLEDKQEVEVRIIELSQEKITLSMKEEEKREDEDIIKSVGSDKGFTLGDIFKKKIKM
ncbi:MAG: S1 RNA-binding domain-containing protein [Acidobacteria bacterium]|nr:MAG: S1 RNA-binding domain-containing protein [Acidobacteriota bacterium]